MILYFADRQLNILGQASTHLPNGVNIAADMKTEDIETGVAVFECDVLFDSKTRANVEAWAEVGNYIFRESDGKNELYSIIEAEIDTRKSKVYIYAEDDGLDLLNEVVEAYTADRYYPISHYIEMYATNAGFEVGINEVEGLTRQLNFKAEQTASARLLEIAEAFDNCEISFSFDIKGLKVAKKYIDIYKKRGNDTGIQLRLNKEIDSIITTKSISNLATALHCTGSTPENSETPITLKGYVYDDGDFYVEGAVLKSRKALEKWKRYLWKDDTEQLGGHIVKQFSYDTTSQEVLCVNAISQLKQICDAEINYEADITKFPEKVRIGDRVDIVDDKGNLYISSRILTLETSEADDSKRAVLGEHIIKKSGISEKVEALAKQFSDIAASREAFLQAKKEIAETQTKVNATEESIAKINSSLSTLVVDGDGVPLMKETDDGWQYSTEEVEKAVNDASESLRELMNNLGSTEAVIEVLRQTVGDIEKKTDYVKIGFHTYIDEQGITKTEPCVELGESDTDYKLLVTNTQILFKVGSNVPTRINADGLVTENITVENELRQGGWIWKVRVNGNLGLSWKGVNS